MFPKPSIQSEQTAEGERRQRCRRLGCSGAARRRKGNPTSEGKQRSRGKEVTAGYVQMAQKTTAAGDRPDYTPVTRCTSQGERAQGRQTREGFRQDLRGQLLGSSQVQTPQALRQKDLQVSYRPDTGFKILKINF